METDGPPGAAAPASTGPALKPEEERYLERFERLKGILDGTASISHYLEFLYSHNHADLQVRHFIVKYSHMQKTPSAIAMYCCMARTQEGFQPEQARRREMLPCYKSLT